MPVGKVYEDYQKSFKIVVSHVNVKRIQAAEFQSDKGDNSKRVLQIDYAMVYQCEYQDEVQSALWTRSIIYLCFNTKFCNKDIVDRYKGKDKYSNGTFIEYLYENHIPKAANISSEIIWSDGPSSEFKVYINYL